MKNIHVIPTKNPSRFCIKITDGFQGYDFHPYSERKLNTWYKPQNIYITNYEKPKIGEWCLSKLNEVVIFSKKFTISLYKKIILTTDQDLIKDGVQAIEDEFLEWFVKNPSCESVETQCSGKNCIEEFGCTKEVCNGIRPLKIIIPKEILKGVYFTKQDGTQEFIEPKQDIIEYSLNAFKVPKDYFGKEEIIIEEAAKFIVFTYQDSEDWTQHSVPLDSFEKADNFAQQFRDKKRSYLICKTIKQGYNGN